MKIAILALTCGRVEETARTWENNLPGLPYPVYWWDNTEDADEAAHILALSKRYNIIQDWHPDKNQGIARPLNVLMQCAFNDGADMVVTMANDILEPSQWVEIRALGFERIENAGIVSIPIYQQNCLRYEKIQINGLEIEQGDIIGNYGIHRSTYEKIGGFPEVYGIYGPIDLDYCAHVRAAGLKTLYVSNYHAYHIGVDNPTEYQKAKDESLSRAWAIYEARMDVLRAKLFSHA